MSRATRAQRDVLRRHLEQADQFDMRTVTIMHRTLGVEDRWIGQPVDVWLDSLTTEQAHTIITNLERQQ